MARTENQSAAIMPKSLIFIAAFSIVALGVDLCLEKHSRNAEPSIAWGEMRYASVMPQAQAATPPPPEMAPESMEAVAEVMSKCKASNKVVLYEFYAPWSDPCKKMESTSLSNKQVKQLVDEKFLAVRITDHFKETGTNPKVVSDLQKKYRVFAFPTLVAVDANGATIGTLVGNCSSLTTYRFLSRSLASTHRAGG